jgi:hypothetical protein
MAFLISSFHSASASRHPAGMSQSISRSQYTLFRQSPLSYLIPFPLIGFAFLSRPKAQLLRIRNFFLDYDPNQINYHSRRYSCAYAPRAIISIPEKQILYHLTGVH